MKASIDKSTKFQSLLVITLGLSILSLIFHWPRLLYIGLGIGVIGLMIPIVGDWIVFLWFKLAEILGWINSRILLSLIFFVFLFPISIFFRLTSKDNLMLKKGRKSTFVDRDHQYVKKDLENTW